MSNEQLVFLQGFEKIPQTIEQKTETLFQHNWAGVLGIDAGELSRLASYLIPYRGPEGAVVFRREELESFMCLISSGGVHIFEGEGQSLSERICSLGPENTVGEMALIDGGPRSAFAVAASETVLYVMTKSSFERLAEDHPSTWGKLLLRIARLMSHRLRQANHCYSL